MKLLVRYLDQLFEYPNTIWVPKKTKYRIWIILFGPTFQIVSNNKLFITPQPIIEKSRIRATLSPLVRVWYSAEWKLLSLSADLIKALDYVVPFLYCRCQTCPCTTALASNPLQLDNQLQGPGSLVCPEEKKTKILHKSRYLSLFNYNEKLEEIQELGQGSVHSYSRFPIIVNNSALSWQ